MAGSVIPINADNAAPKAADFFPFSFMESAVPKAAPDCAKLFARELTRSVVQPVDAIC